MDDGLRRSAAWFLVTWEWVFLFAGILAMRLDLGASVGDARQVPLVLGLGSGILAVIVMAVAMKLGGRPVRALALLGLLPAAWIGWEFARRAGETFG